MDKSEALKATALLNDDERGKQFVHLRRHYPIRRRWMKQSMKAKALFEGV